MTRLLYDSDPYLVSFESVVERIDGEWVVLEETAFFPGGGGQEADRGMIEGLQVTDIRLENGAIAHRIPAHTLKVGQRVKCTIDWGRRHDLMKGHTAEHLLFSAISRLAPEIELVKIAISPDKKSFVVKGSVGWPLLSEAQRIANDAVLQGLPTTELRVEREDLILKGARVKLDRIHGDVLRIVRIGEIDTAACAGLHVRNTKEIEVILVTKLSSARPAGDLEIEFDIGTRAMSRSLELAAYALQASEVLGSHPRDLVGALVNLKADALSMRESLRRSGREALRNMSPRTVGEREAYSGIFEGIEKKTLIDAANLLVKREGVICVLVSRDDRILLIIACHPKLDIDCVKALNDVLLPFGGKGGGQRHFAVGGAPDPKDGEKALTAALDALGLSL